MSIDPRVDIGHVHLKVSDIDRALSFYRDILGFEVMQRLGDQAAFVSAGGYHHHLGLNTWAGEGAPPASPGASGLRHYTIEVPQAADLTAISDRLAGAGVAVTDAGDGAFLVDDPSRNRVLLRVRP